MCLNFVKDFFVVSFPSNYPYLGHVLTFFSNPTFSNSWFISCCHIITDCFLTISSLSFYISVFLIFLQNHNCFIISLKRVGLKFSSGNDNIFWWIFFYRQVLLLFSHFENMVLLCACGVCSFSLSHSWLSFLFGGPALLFLQEAHDGEDERLFPLLLECELLQGDFYCHT